MSEHDLGGWIYGICEWHRIVCDSPVPLIIPWIGWWNFWRGTSGLAWASECKRNSVWCRTWLRRGFLFLMRGKIRTKSNWIYRFYRIAISTFPAFDDSTVFRMSPMWCITCGEISAATHIYQTPLGISNSSVFDCFWNHFIRFNSSTKHHKNNRLLSANKHSG